MTVPKDLVALMSAVGTGSSVHTQNPDLMVFTFTQKVFYIHMHFKRPNHRLLYCHGLVVM